MPETAAGTFLGSAAAKVGMLHHLRMVWSAGRPATALIQRVQWPLNNAPSGCINPDEVHVLSTLWRKRAARSQRPQ